MKTMLFCSICAGVISALLYTAALAEGRAPPNREGAAPTAPPRSAHLTSEQSHTTYPRDTGVNPGWRITVEQHDDGARTVLTATPAVAKQTGRTCTTQGLAACLEPLQQNDLLEDCRDQGVTGRWLGRELRLAAETGPVRIVTETGGYPWRCHPEGREAPAGRPQLDDPGPFSGWWIANTRTGRPALIGERDDALRIARRCEQMRTLRCLYPLAVPFLIFDCRRQGVKATQIAKQIRRDTGHAVIAAYGPWHWTCRVL